MELGVVGKDSRLPERCSMTARELFKECDVMGTPYVGWQTLGYVHLMCHLPDRPGEMIDENYPFAAAYEYIYDMRIVSEIKSIYEYDNHPKFKELGDKTIVHFIPNFKHDVT